MGTNLFGIAFRKKYYKGKIINDNLKIFKTRTAIY
jgi:hypothetical protein